MRTGRRRMAVAATAVALSSALLAAGCTPGFALPVAGSASPDASPSADPGDSASPSPSGLTPSAVPTNLSTPAPAAPLGPGAAVAAAPQAGRAPTQTYLVGSRQLDLNRGGNRPLRTVLWYPAVGSGGTGAAPADGVFPLVLFSHGLTATPETYQRITTRMAAAGFIVAAPAYPYTNGAATTYNPADIINQPADASFVITAVLGLNSTTGDPLAGHVDAGRIAAAGHSGGGYTTVGMLAGARDTRLRAAVVIAGGSLGGAFTGPAASVLFIHGDADPIVTYGIGRAAYGMVPWPKAFLTITGGDHTSYLFTSSTATTAVSTSTVDFLRWALYGDGSAKGRLGAEASVAGATTFETSL
jgi:poly(3-hydroxybutyrate) depolymerase